MYESAQPGEVLPSANAEGANTGTSRTSPVGSASEKSNGSRALEEAELDSALQLLVERAQYITGATGTALALPQGEEMVCRASAGSSAPAVGVRLQVRSGLTGESVSRRQLLRCDNAETDPRVNLEACRALGIASIVVLPLLRRNGEVRGLFELFSDHPYAFEERDLIALERMADLTLTALDLAEQRLKVAPAQKKDKSIELSSGGGGAESDLSGTEGPRLDGAEPRPHTEAAEAPSVPEAMLRVQKCPSCGFPISEGRTLCLDCELKGIAKAREKEQDQNTQREPGKEAPSDLAAPMAAEFVPAFLANSVPVRESWLANHVNVLAIVVLILGILVAVVVFR